MAWRTTGDEVKEIIDTTLTADEVAPFITAANLTVTDVLANEGYGDGLMAEIERWLAAHLVAARDPRVAAEKFADGQATYQGKYGLGLDGTAYGQQVKMLDYKGRLASVDAAKRPARVEAVNIV